MSSWIKLHRSMMDHWLYKEHRPMTRREAWETMLLLVNYEPSKTMINGTLYECDRGQSLLSIGSWADKFLWSIKQVRTFFKLLEKDGMIAVEGLRHTTRLTICNYGLYQDKGRTDGVTEGVTEGEQREQQRATIKEGKELKEGEEGKEVNTPLSPAIASTPSPKNSKFITPTVDEIQTYCTERKNNIDSAHFFDYNEARGWMVGKNKMKDWKAAIRTWEKNGFSTPLNNNQQKQPSMREAWNLK